MGTRFYFNTTAPSVVPTWPRKAVSLPVAQHQDHATANVEKSLGTVSATPLTALTVTSIASTDPQSIYFGRFTSEPLAAQEFPAQTWHLYMSLGCTNAAAGTMHRPTLYFYRPSTGAIQYVFDGSTNPLVRVVYAGGGPIIAEGKVAVANSFTVQNGDVLVYEFWSWGDATMATAYVQTASVNDTAAYIEPTATTVAFYTGPVGVNTPSTADPLIYAPMGLYATTDVAVLSSVATPFAHTALSAFDATSTIARAPVLTSSIALPTSYAYTPSLNTAATVSRNTTSMPTPAPSYAVTARSASDNIEIRAGPLTFTPMAAFDATSTVGIKVSVTSVADIASYATSTAYDTRASSVLSSSATPPVSYTLNGFDATGTYSVSVPLISTLTENFEAPLDTNKWTTSGVSGSVTVSGGVANFAVTNGIAGAKCNLTSKNFFNLRGSRVFAKVVQPLRQTGDPPNNSYSLGVKSAGENYVAWAFNTAGTLAIHKFTNDAWDGELAAIATGIYATPDTFRWLGIRENAGTIYFESAPNSASNPPTEGQWVVRHSVLASTLSVDPSACQFIAWIYIGLGATTTAPFQIDGINTATSAAIATTSTALPAQYTVGAFDATGIKAASIPSSALSTSYALAAKDATGAVKQSITSQALPAQYTLGAFDATGVRAGLGRQLIETLTENFGAALDTNKWIASGVNGSVTASGGVAVFSVTNGISGAKCSLQSKELFDLRESGVFAKVVQPWRLVGDPAANSFSLGLISAGDNYIEWAVGTNGSLEIHKFTNGAFEWVAEVAAAPAAFSDTHRWLRISERAGTTYFESAPGTASNPPTAGQWVVRYSALTNTLPIDASACSFITWIYVNVGGTTSLPLQIDGVNTATVGVGGAITSSADPTSYTLAPATLTAATVARRITSDALPAAYALAPATLTAAARQVASTALPAGFAWTPAALTTAGRSWASVAVAGSWALDPGPGYGSIGRVTNAQPGSFSQAALPITSSFAVAAGFSTYAYSPTATTISLGRVYTSTALPAGYAVTPSTLTSARAAFFASAGNAEYLGAYATTTNTVYIKPIAQASAALPVEYTLSAFSSTVSLGRVFVSDATKTSYSVNAVESFASLARVSDASKALYSWSGVSATSGQLIVYFSNALQATYSYSGKDTTDGFARFVPSDATKATYSSLALESFGYALRSSVALPFSFTFSVSGLLTTTRFDRTSAALPIEYIVTGMSTTTSGGANIVSAALLFEFKLSGAWGGSAVNKNSIANGTSYTVTVPTSTVGVPTKNSIAWPTRYDVVTPNVQSGRATFSVALPTSYLVSLPSIYVPNTHTSAALPRTYTVSTPATTHRYGYASQANPARYLWDRESWLTVDLVPSIVKPPIVFPLPVLRAAVTDAQFNAWIEDDRAVRVILIETKCVEPVSGAVEAVYFASSSFVTKLEDVLSVFYAPLMRGGLDFAQAIDLDLQGNQSYGDIELDNSSGDLDWMFDRVWLYKEFKAYVGDATWPRRDFRQIFDGTIEDIDSSVRDTVNVRLRDKLYRLDMPLSDMKVGGTGPNASRLVPITFGECHNITPVLVSQASLIYVYHTRVTERVIEVRDNGIPVAFNFLAGAPASFQLQKQPFGRITCSVQGDRTAGGVFGTGYVSSVAALTQRLMKEWGTEKNNRFTAEDIDVSNFNYFDTRNKAPVGLYATERTTVLDACQQIAGSVGGRLTMTALGKAQLVKLKLPPTEDTTPINLQYNGDFSLQLDGWTYIGGVGGIAPNADVGLNLPGGWFIPGQNTFYSHQMGIANNPNAYFEYLGNAATVEPNKRYVVSAYSGSHRARFAILFYEYNDKGEVVDRTPLSTTAFNNVEKNGGTTLDAYKRVYDSKITSPNTVWIRVALRKYDTTSGETDSWMFVNNVSLIGAEVNVTPPIVVTESDMVAGSLHIADRLPMVPGVRLGYCRNWTVQEDTSQGVPEEHKAMYAKEWLTIALTEETARNKYGIWSESEQENCLLLEKVSASAECDRRVKLRSEQRHVYEFVGFARLMFTPVGAAMTVKHRRFNLSEGKTGQVVSVAVNWLTTQVTIRVLI